MGFYDTIIITGTGNDFSTWISVIITAIIGIVTIYLMVSLFRKEQRYRAREIYALQISLLNSLFVELNQISSPSNDIHINGKIYPHKGNLEWYEKDILPKYKKNKGTPPHEVWKMNTSEYLAKLHNKVDKKDTIELKKLLILINQKLELVRNYFSGGIEAKEIEGVIKETKVMVGDAKEVLRKEFNIR